MDTKNKFYLNEKVRTVVEGGVSAMKNLEQVATRKGFGDGLLLAGKENVNVVVLTADLTDSTQVENFKKVFPERFFEMGVAEQNMASVASGMAAVGKIPFITSYAMFSPGRNWEQIRTTICYNDMPVKIVGCHAGISVGPDGGTHQALEDVALMRVVPNMIVVVPVDAVEAKKATQQIAKNGKPTYLRLFREKSPVLTDESTDFNIGDAVVFYESNKSFENNTELDYNKNSKRILILANGEMVSRSLLCVSEIEAAGCEVCVVNVATVKPLDERLLVYFCEKYKNILIAEETQIASGLGSAVLELLAQSYSLRDKKIQIVGVLDRFGQSGTKEQLYEEYGLNEKSILRKAMEMLDL